MSQGSKGGADAGEEEDSAARVEAQCLGKQQGYTGPAPKPRPSAATKMGSPGAGQQEEAEAAITMRLPRMTRRSCWSYWPCLPRGATDQKKRLSKSPTQRQVGAAMMPAKLSPPRLA